MSQLISSGQLTRDAGNCATLLCCAVCLLNCFLAAMVPVLCHLLGQVSYHLLLPHLLYHDEAWRQLLHMLLVAHAAVDSPSS